MRFLLCLLFVGLWQVTVQDYLLSQGKSTSQSSTGWSGSSSRGVDGNTNKNYGGSSCTHTQLSSNPWWQVDLGSVSLVNRVKIFNRQDCCGSRLGGLKIKVSLGGSSPFVECASGPSSTSNGQVLNLNCNREAKIVRIQLPGNSKYLTLCEVQVFGYSNIRQLLSQGKSTSQSSTGWSGSPSRGVDGNTNKNYGGGSCTHTQLSSNPWWQVDLGSINRITSVTVYNRQDCCAGRLGGFKVMVSTGGGFTQCGAGPSSTSAGQVINVQCNADAKFVRIQIPGSNKYLTLCEVKVYGIPSQLLSQSKSTSQSSTGWSGSSSRGVDGNTNKNYGGSSCTHTQLSSNPWWQVDLGSVNFVTGVTVYNRQDCCAGRLGGYKILVSKGGSDPFVECASGPSSTSAGQIIARDCMRAARIVRIQIPGSGKYLTLCEVKVFGKGSQLLSQGKSTSQSSTGWSGSSSRGVDGNTNKNYGGGSCTHTQLSSNPWWQVDLGRMAFVSKVTVYNRQDCCAGRLGGFKVYVSNGGNSPFVQCGSGPSSTSAGQVINVDCNRTGRIVRIKIPGSNKYLTLCEVKVFGI